jgi:hypothetical protein
MCLRKPRKHQLLPGIRREPYCRELREFLKKKHKKKTSYLAYDESLIAGNYENFKEKTHGKKNQLPGTRREPYCRVLRARKSRCGSRVWT